MTNLVQRLGVRLFNDASAPFLEQGGVTHTSGVLRDRVVEFEAALAEAGVSAGERVAVALPMGLDFLAAILAIWRSATSYVPLPPDEAFSRSLAMARTAGVRALVAEDCSPLAGGDAPFASVAIRSGGGLEVLRGAGAGGINAPGEAYVIFTSGSTGAPKGVSISHAALDFYWRNAIDHYRLPDMGWRIPLALPATFDASLTSILALFTTHNVGTILDHGSPTSDLANLVRRSPQRLFLKTTPSQLRLLGSLLGAQSARRATGVFVVGGEQLHFEDFAAFQGDGNLMIFNEYGPTEATVGCIVHAVDASKARRGPVPIGRPFAGVGTRFDPVGDGDLAELVLSGPGLADRYVNTDIPSGFFERDGCRYYATGDLVRRDQPTGEWYFVGRRDNQVKLNGFRIELSEIETALSEVAPGAASVAATAIGDRLVAVLAGVSDPDPNSIRARLRDLLPGYMMPDELRFVDALAVTAHGKLDRAALQGSLSVTEKEPETDNAPEDGLAALAVQAWTDVLRCPAPGPKTDFFASGGDSVAALRLMGRLASHFEGRLPVTLLFDHPEFGDFVSAIASQLAPVRDPAQTTEDEVAKAVRLSPNQLAIVTGHVANPDKSAYTVASAVEVSGIEDWSGFSAAASGTVSRHDVFRWRLCEHEDWGAAACPASTTGIGVQVEFADSGSGVESFLFECRHAVVDPFQSSPVIRFRILETGPMTAIAVMLTHHCFVDELSVSLLWCEIFDRLLGKVPPDGSPFSYRAWSDGRLTGIAGANVAEATRRAAARIGDICPRESTPMRGAERPGGNVVATHAFRIPHKRIDDARVFAGALSTSATTVLSAAAGWTLSRLLGVAHLVNHAPVTQRRSEAEFGAVGCFVANLPSVFVAPSPGSPAVEIVKGWRNAVAALLEDSDADPVELEALLQARTGLWDRVLRVSIATEQGFRGTSGDVTWITVPIVAGAPKFDLVWMLSLGRSDGPATVRIVAGPDVSGVDMAALELTFVETLDAILSPGGRAPGLDGLRRPASGSPVSVAHAFEAADQAWPGDQQAISLTKTVADACSDTLGVVVRTDGDLFMNGLKSLTALKLVARLHALGHPHVSVADIYEFRTPIRIAQYMAAQDFLQWSA